MFVLYECMCGCKHWEFHFDHLPIQLKETLCVKHKGLMKHFFLTELSDLERNPS